MRDCSDGANVRIMSHLTQWADLVKKNSYGTVIIQLRGGNSYCGAGFPACSRQNLNDGRLESLPHSQLSASWRKYGHGFVYSCRCGARHVRTDLQRPLVGCGDSALRAGEPHRQRSSSSEISDLKTRQMRFIPLRGIHHILRSQGKCDTVFRKRCTKSTGTARCRAELNDYMEPRPLVHGVMSH